MTRGPVPAGRRTLGDAHEHHADGAIALVWSDNAYQSDPANFQNYGSTAPATVWTTTSADQLDSRNHGRARVLVARSPTGASLLPRHRSGIDGFESNRSPLRADTPRPDARNVVLFALQAQTQGSGFRFWDDLNDDGAVQSQELGLVRDGTSNGIDFFVDRDGVGDLFLTPVRAGTGVEYYDERPGSRSHRHRLAEDRDYRTSESSPFPAMAILRDGRRRRVPALRRAPGDPRGDLPHHGLGVPDRSGESELVVKRGAKG
jgi:hypothetical protein